MDNVYITKPIKVKAIQWNGKNANEIMTFLKWKNVEHDNYSGLVMHTPTGNHQVNVGDFVIEGVTGKFHFQDENTFKNTYYTQQEYKAL